MYGAQRLSCFLCSLSFITASSIVCGPVAGEDAADSRQVPLHLQPARSVAYLAGNDQHHVHRRRVREYRHGAVETRVL